LKPHWLAISCGALALLVAAPAAVGSTVDPIVNGSPASSGEYPAQGFLEIDEGASFCGGTLVGSTWFLTAAHCVVEPGGPLAPERLVVGLGHTNVNEITDVYSVTSVDVHSSYSDPTNDVAMLRLGRAAPYQPLRVIGIGETALWAPGTPARIIGWGTTSSGGSPSIDLLEADAPVRSDEVPSPAPAPLSRGPIAGSGL